MLNLHTHFNPTLTQFESFWAIFGCLKNFISSFDLPFKPTTKIEKKMIIRLHLTLLLMQALHKP